MGRMSTQLSYCFSFLFWSLSRKWEIGSDLDITLFAISRVICVLGAVTVFVIIVVVFIKIVIIIVEICHVDVVVCGRFLLRFDAVPRGKKILATNGSGKSDALFFTFKVTE